MPYSKVRAGLAAMISRCGWRGAPCIACWQRSPGPEGVERMEMNSPVGPNALDEQGIVGKPLNRVDGRLKVTGGARYAYEMQQDSALYGFVVEASIAKGTIRSIDTRAAEKAPGVMLVLTHRNAPPQGTGNHRQAHPVLTSPQVTHYGQPVAFVVAESFEQARAAAYLVDVKYDRSSGKYALRTH